MATRDEMLRKSGPGRYLRLKDEGEKCRVAFVVNTEADDYGASFYPIHWLGDKYGACTGEGCQHCARGNTAIWRMAITVLNLDTEQVQILDGFPGMWIEDLERYLKKYDWQEYGFEIERTGKKSKTRRNLMPEPLTDEQKLALKMAVPFTPDELMPKPRAEQSTQSIESDDPLDPGPDDDDMPF